MITYNGYWFLWNIIGASQGSNSGTKGKPDEGWTKLSNGLIFQWGTSYVGNKCTTWVNFPRKFPTKCLVVIGSDTGAWTGHSGSECDVSFYGYNQTGFYMFGLDNDFDYRHNWIAIGY